MLKYCRVQGKRQPLRSLPATCMAFYDPVLVCNMFVKPSIQGSHNLGKKSAKRCRHFKKGKETNSHYPSEGTAVLAPPNQLRRSGVFAAGFFGDACGVPFPGVMPPSCPSVLAIESASATLISA